MGNEAGTRREVGSRAHFLIRYNTAKAKPPRRYSMERTIRVPQLSVDFNPWGQKQPTEAPLGLQGSSAWDWTRRVPARVWDATPEELIAAGYADTERHRIPEDFRRKRSAAKAR